MTSDLQTSLSDVLRRIPLKTRRELAAQIQTLCSSTGLENDFMNNRCGLHAGARSLSAKAKIRQTADIKRSHMPRYWVHVEGQTVPKPCTLAEAAKLMKVTETSLKVRVSSYRNFEKDIYEESFQKSDHISGHYVCSKMTQDELDEQLHVLNEKIQLGQFDIQSVSPTRL
jgi:hypothetical protein